MDQREDLIKRPADDGEIDMRERLRASIARQKAAIKRAAEARIGARASHWPDRRESEAAFRALAEAWEREVLLPQRGWEPSPPDPPIDSLGCSLDETPAKCGDSRERIGRLEPIRNAVAALFGDLSKLVRHRSASSAPTAATGRCDCAAQAANAKPTRDDRDGGDVSGPIGDRTVVDPIGDFAARILEELLDKDGGPRHEHGRR